MGGRSSTRCGLADVAIVDGKTRAMKTRIIDNFESFNTLRPEWEELFAHDSRATVFLSWPFLRGYMESLPYRWLILQAIDDQGATAGFLPLTLRCSGYGCRRLQLAGNPAADYNGFLLRRGKEEQTLLLWAGCLDEMEWDLFDVRDFVDDRLHRLLELFAPDSYVSRIYASTPCPVIDLPADWEEYLSCRLGRMTRKHIRAGLRAVAERYRTSVAAEADLHDHVQALLGLWQDRWGRAKPELLRRFCGIFERCAQAGLLRLTVLWDGQRPISAQALLVDRPHESVYTYMGAFDPAYGKTSPGKLMDALDIRWAIKNGFRRYDFLRGSYDYKLSLGAKPRPCLSILLERRTFRRTIGRVVWALQRRLSGLRSRGGLLLP